MKEIKINKKHKVFVDDEDYEFLKKMKWTITSSSDGKVFYAVTCLNGKTIGMHRLILYVTDPKIKIDHIDGNGLNNQKFNLRFSNHSQNCSNRTRPHKFNTSGYRGVYKIYNKKGKWTGRWKAKLGTKYLGSFKDPMLAALAYDKAALEKNAEFAGRLNYTIILNKITSC